MEEDFFTAFTGVFFAAFFRFDATGFREVFSASFFLSAFFVLATRISRGLSFLFSLPLFLVVPLISLPLFFLLS